MTEKYIRNNYDNIKMYENIIENRKKQEDIKIDELIKENKYNLDMCRKYGNEYVLIDDKYDINLEI